jgi:hypothetical protein
MAESNPTFKGDHPHPCSTCNYFGVNHANVVKVNSCGRPHDGTEIWWNSHNWGCDFHSSLPDPKLAAAKKAVKELDLEADGAW